MISVYIMFAIITTGYLPLTREVDVLAFKTKEKCESSIEPIRKELLKTVQDVQLACIERKLY